MSSRRPIFYVSRLPSDFYVPTIGSMSTTCEERKVALTGLAVEKMPVESLLGIHLARPVVHLWASKGVCCLCLCRHDLKVSVLLFLNPIE